MKIKRCIAVGITLCLVLILCYWRPIESIEIPSASNPDGETVTAIRLPPFLIERQLSLKNMSLDAATKLYLRKSAKDDTYDFRVALNFYGKVEDGDGHPVQGALVRLMWNTVLVPSGSQYEQAVSDKDGLFSLTGKYGKHLGVQVSKPDYYTIDGPGAEVPFEFADPSSPHWYEPDANQPYIFHL